jgi:ZIP family zinc transporter
MGFSELVLLGAIAGFTIYLGLPAGRLGGVDERVRVALPMFSVSILAFIFMDVTKHGQEIVDATLGGFKDHRTSLLHVVGLFSLLAAGFTAGTAGIATIQRSLRVAGRQTPGRIADRDDHCRRDRVAQLRRRAGDRRLGVRPARSASPRF